jgi:hypothetical protein
MTATGHKARAEAIAEAIRRRGTHTREVVRQEHETLSPEAKALILSLQQQVDELRATQAAMLAAIAAADRTRGAA